MKEKKGTKVTSESIVMLGDSLTQFAGNWNILLTGVDKGRFVNCGLMGDDALGVYDRLDDVLPYHPQKIFLMVGVNDISHQLPADEVAELVGRICNEIRKASPESVLYLQSLLPINESFHCWETMEGKTDVVVDVNRRLQHFASSKGIVYINLFPLFVEEGTNILRRELSIDGLHINADGYAIWKEALQPYIGTTSPK